MPASVRDAVLARTAGLAPPVRRCLELLSCTPEPVGPELLDALGVSTATVGVLAATGLIDRHGRGVAFRHEIARSAVLGAAVPGSEPALHAAMIDALEAVGADPSVLAHHAAAAGDVARVLRYAPAAAAEASRSGAHREAVAFYEAALRHVGDDTATRAGLLEAMSDELYLTDRLRDAIAARERALELRRELGEVVAVGAAHTALSGFAWYAADRGLRRAARPRRPSRSSRTADDRRALGFALARHAFLAAQRGDTAEARRSGDRAARIADELGDDVVLRGTASIGVAVARLLDGDVGGRADLLAAADVGLRHRLDDLATTPMSNLCHFDVEQGRFAEAEESVADALRISEERDTPICTACQLGVRARLRLLQGRWAEAEDDARAVLRSGELPLSQLWPHLVLGMLVARRDGLAGEPAPGRAVAAGEPARQPRHGRGRRGRARRERLDHPAPGPPARRSAGDGAVHPGVRRPGRRAGRPCGAGRGASPTPAIQQVGPARRPAPRRLPENQPYEQALALWDAGTTDDLLAALPLLDDARRPGGGRAVPRPAARGGREQRPPGPVAGHPGQPGRADRAPARRAGPAGRRPEQRRHRRAAGHLPQDRRPPRVGDPGQAGRPLAGRGGGRRPPPRRRGRSHPGLRARTSGHPFRAAAAAFRVVHGRRAPAVDHDVLRRQRHPGRRPQPAAGPEPAGGVPLEVALDLGGPTGVDRHGQHRRRAGEPDGVLHRHRPAAGPQFRGRRGAVAGQDDPVLHRVAGEPPVGDDSQVHAEGHPDGVAGDVRGPVEVGHHLAESDDRDHRVDGAEGGRDPLASAGRQRDPDLPHGHLEDDQHGDHTGWTVVVHMVCS